MTKEEAVQAAIDAAKRNYGQDIDIDVVVEQLEASGWRWEG